jgi:hypothetical protein
MICAQQPELSVSSWHVRDMPTSTANVCSLRHFGSPVSARSGPLMTQAVWKRFSYPNNCKQQGVMDLDATG